MNSGKGGCAHPKAAEYCEPVAGVLISPEGKGIQEGGRKGEKGGILCSHVAFYFLGVRE